MNRNMKYTLMLCLSLVLMFGSAMAEMGNNTTQPSADTPSNYSINETEDMDDVTGGNGTDDAAGGNGTDDAAGGNGTDDVAGGNGTDDVAG
ncbi:MAG: hypothetical protein M8353_04400, partial [ANME-2 cluster archaeon]|nr:hypothetical protein [ANME-2 cluster archaeon]